VSLTTRGARAEDEDRVFALLAQLLDTPAPGWAGCRETYRELLDSGRGEIIVAEDGPEVVGVITFSINVAIRYAGSYAQIEELVIDADCRGKGAGAALVNAALASARAHGCREAGLYARERNRPFYEKLGFTYTGPELRQSLD
jgi:ribosomal protein S18 acetylase RimI-like enzyme